MNQIYIKNIYQKNIRGDDTKTYQLFAIPIGNAKTADKIKFHLAAPVLKYHQKAYNSYCWISLASAFCIIGYNSTVTALLNFIEE